MSQIYKPGSGGGDVVNLNIITDDGTITSSGNTLNLLGFSVDTNNELGIQTHASPTGSVNGTVELTNRMFGSTSTTGVTTSSMITFSPGVIGTYAIECRVSAYNTTSQLGAGYSIFGTARFDGTNMNLCGTPDKIVNEEGAMSAGNCTMTVSGPSVLINGVGYAAQTINWSGVGLYTFTGV